MLSDACMHQILLNGGKGFQVSLPQVSVLVKDTLQFLEESLVAIEVPPLDELDEVCTMAVPTLIDTDEVCTMAVPMLVDTPKDRSIHARPQSCTHASSYDPVHRC